MQFLNTLSLLLLAAPLSVLAGAHIPPQVRHARHTEVAKRSDGHVALHKRFTNSRWTWYLPQSLSGIGSCGGRINDGDFVVALNAPQYENGRHCGRTVILEYAGVTQRAVIGDLCPECAWGSLDLTRGLWLSFPPIPGDGVLETGVWNFEGEGGGGQPQNNQPPQQEQPQQQPPQQEQPQQQPPHQEQPQQQPPHQEQPQQQPPHQEQPQQPPPHQEQPQQQQPPITTPPVAQPTPAQAAPHSYVSTIRHRCRNPATL